MFSGFLEKKENGNRVRDIFIYSYLSPPPSLKLDEFVMGWCCGYDATMFLEFLGEEGNRNRGIFIHTFKTPSFRGFIKKLCLQRHLCISHSHLQNIYFLLKLHPFTSSAPPPVHTHSPLLSPPRGTFRNPSPITIPALPSLITSRKWWPRSG